MVMISGRVRNIMTVVILIGLLATGNVVALAFGTFCWMLVCVEMTVHQTMYEIASIHGSDGSGGELNQTMLIGMIDSE